MTASGPCLLLGVFPSNKGPPLLNEAPTAPLMRESGDAGGTG
jgi:hypothetical protein